MEEIWVPITVAIVAIAPLFVGRQIGRTAIEKDLAAWEKMPESPTRERLLKSIEQRIDAMIIQKWGVGVRAFMVLGVVAIGVGGVSLWRNGWKFDDTVILSLLYGVSMASVAISGAQAQGARIKARQAVADAEERRRTLWPAGRPSVPTQPGSPG